MREFEVLRFCCCNTCWNCRACARSLGVSGSAELGWEREVLGWSKISKEVSWKVWSFEVWACVEDWVVIKRECYNYEWVYLRKGWAENGLLVMKKNSINQNLGQIDCKFRPQMNFKKLTKSSWFVNLVKTYMK